MLVALAAFGVGLVVGWHFIPQPKWIAEIFAKKATPNVP